MELNHRIDEAENSADRQIVSPRVFDAHRELLFKMWTDPKHLAQWWRPKGFTKTFHELDLRPGGFLNAE